MNTNDCAIFGLHAVQALLDSSAARVKQLYVLKGRHDKRLKVIHRLAERHHIPVSHVSRDSLDQMVSGNHQGVVAEIEQKTEVYDEPYLKSHLVRLMDQGEIPFLLVLDGVTDPHNLGACLRSAEAAGVQFVIVPKAYVGMATIAVYLGRGSCRRSRPTSLYYEFNRAVSVSHGRRR
jgi:23S rRNA (guanosine2251-2'-O)-methyltransferase